MIRGFTATLVIGGLFFSTLVCRAAENPPPDLAQLNKLTGSDPMSGALKRLQADREAAKKLIAQALPLAKEPDKLTYNGAMVLALAAADQKDLKTAETFFRVCMDRAIKLQSLGKLFQSYFPLIELYLENKNYDQSTRLCKELLELKTDDGKSRVVMFPTVNRFGEIVYDEDDHFDTAERLRPLVHRFLIELTTKKGDYQEALKLADNLIKARDHWRQRELKAWVLREAGKFEDAAKAYDDVISGVNNDKDMTEEERDKTLDRYKYTLSNIYVDMNKIDKAAEILQELLKKKPNDPGLNNDLGYIWADHNMNLEEAEKLIRKALDLDRKRRKAAKLPADVDRENGAYLDSLGWVLYKKKQFKEAKDVLLKAVEDKESQHIEIYDHLGDVHLALGERDLAVQAWRKGLEIVGDNRRDVGIKEIVEKKITQNSK
jgi:tetratricopeptide (TPR) repeat protein